MLSNRVCRGSVLKPYGIPCVSNMKKMLPNKKSRPIVQNCKSEVGETMAVKFGKKFIQVFAFRGPAPEIVNGRLAMLGFAIGVMSESTEKSDLAEQLANGGFNWLFFNCLVFTFASIVPMFSDFTFSNSNPLYKEAKYAELLNGRLAMLGFVAFALLEHFVVHGPLFA